jgi:GNAT superfamily N-acetyltransferase
MLSVRKAETADLPVVHGILHSVAGWLHERGYDQWPDESPSLGPQRLGGQIERGEMHLVLRHGEPAGTIALSAHGDRDFWLPHELAEPAVYVSKAAVLREHAGAGMGALVLRWAVDQADATGARWVRLDAWRTNTALHAYYARQGWAHVRTVSPAGRNSGALFQRLALPDTAARGAVGGTASLPSLPHPLALSPYPAGTGVLTQDWLAGTVVAAYGMDAGQGLDGSTGSGEGLPALAYAVRLESGSVITAAGADLTPACSL